MVKIIHITKILIFDDAADLVKLPTGREV